MAGKLKLQTKWEENEAKREEQELEGQQHAMENEHINAAVKLMALGEAEAVTAGKAILTALQLV